MIDKFEIVLTTNYQEDEIQALIVLGELSDPIETRNNNFYKFYPKSIAEAQTYFRRFALDISDACETLARKGLVLRGDNTWRLTEAGRVAAQELRRARPPIWYWYKDFYTAIENSQAFSAYCEGVFGKDLSQHGFSDLVEIHLMLEIVRLDKTKRVLDIGCGNGKIAEYISDMTQAWVTGVDYIPEAISQAKRRTANKQDRLHFLVGNLEALELEKKSYDLIVSIDSIFFGQEMSITLANLKTLLKPGGAMAIFCSDDLLEALKQNGLTCSVYDRSRAHYRHLQLKHRVASRLKEAFEAEGNGFIWENLMAESLDNTAPYDPGACSMTRYLYYVRKH
jgi:2-polyprenyl-3-methyl-5-hydroxy-6-metoxy-1,4-benzoquinol methylase